MVGKNRLHSGRIAHEHRFDQELQIRDDGERADADFSVAAESQMIHKEHADTAGKVTDHVRRSVKADNTDLPEIRLCQFKLVGALFGNDVEPDRINDRTAVSDDCRGSCTPDAELEMLHKVEVQDTVKDTADHDNDGCNDGLAFPDNEDAQLRLEQDRDRKC